MRRSLADDHSRGGDDCRFAILVAAISVTTAFVAIAARATLVALRPALALRALETLAFTFGAFRTIAALRRAALGGELAIAAITLAALFRGSRRAFGSWGTFSRNPFGGNGWSRFACSGGLRSCALMARAWLVTRPALLGTAGRPGRQTSISSPARPARASVGAATVICRGAFGRTPSAVCNS